MDAIEPELVTAGVRERLRVAAERNGIGYLRPYFDFFDFTAVELRLANVVTICLGELHTEHSSGTAL